MFTGKIYLTSIIKIVDGNSGISDNNMHPAACLVQWMLPPCHADLL